MKTVGIVILILVAVLAGSCSLVSIFAIGPESFFLSLPGLGIALLCGLWVKSLSRDGSE